MTLAFSTLHGEKCLLQPKVKVASILTVIKFELQEGSLLSARASSRIEVKLSSPRRITFQMVLLFLL